MTTINFDSSSVMTFDGKEYLMLLLPDYESKISARKFSSEQKGKYIAELKKYRRKRSLTSNAYFWLLIGELAAVLKIPTTEIYRNYIKEIGDNYEIMPIREDAVEKFKVIWSSNGIGWITDDLGKSKIKGYRNLRVYYGSSTYNADQMGRLIDMLVQDCQAQGIQTKPPDEIARIIEEHEQSH